MQKMAADRFDDLTRLNADGCFTDLIEYAATTYFLTAEKYPFR